MDQLSGESWNWLQKVEIKLIDSLEVKAQQDIMADRWGESNNVFNQNLRENAKRTPSKGKTG